jgi:DNA-binding transcriptional ArsR family regulator
MKKAIKLPVIANDKLRLSSEILRALAHPFRMMLLEFIDEHKSVNVNKIYSSLQIEQSVTSQHLSILRKAGIVTAARDGKFIFYSIDYAKVEEAAHVATVFSEFTEEDFDADFDADLD